MPSWRSSVPTRQRNWQPHEATSTTRAHGRDQRSPKFPRRNFCPAVCWCGSRRRWSRPAPSVPRPNLPARVCWQKQKPVPTWCAMSSPRCSATVWPPPCKPCGLALISRNPWATAAPGLVVAVGDGVADINVGDRVACAGAGYAVHAEFACVPRLLVAKIPDAIFRNRSCRVRTEQAPSAAASPTKKRPSGR